MPARRRAFGSVTKLPSGHWRARYRHGERWASAPTTFAEKDQALAWLAGIQADLLKGVWVDPAAGCVTLGEYASRWLEERQGLRPRTVELYHSLLQHHILPFLGGRKLVNIKAPHVRTWHASLAKAKGSDLAAKSYRLLRTVLATATADGLLPANPCTLKGAGVEHPAERRIPDLATVEAVADKVDERHRALVLTAALAGLRAGELRGLERRHINLVKRTITVEQQAQRVSGKGRVLAPPKSRAGMRTLAIPASLAEALDKHLANFVAAEPEAPVFTGEKGGPLQWQNWSKEWRKAALSVGAEGLHFHDLRHLAGTLAAATGASTRELMARLGHSTPRAALIYQHATEERDTAIAAGIEAIIDAAKRASTPSIVRIAK